MAQSKLDAETTMKRKRAVSESDGGDDDTTAHWDFQRRFQEFKKMTFRSQTSEAMEQLPALMRLSCADSDSRTATSFRSILKHGGFKNRNYVVIYQRLLYFWWQQNGDDRLQVDTICEENVQFTAVLDVCEKLSQGCSVDEAKEALATIAVQLTDDDKKNGHLYMALLSINKGKSGAANAALEALLCDDKGLSQIAVQSEKTKEVVVYALETLLKFGYTVKAGEACTVGQSTDTKYRGDYDCFFKILRASLPPGFLKTQIVVVCSTPEIPRDGSWNDAALRRHIVHGNLRILMVSLFQIMLLM